MESRMQRTDRSHNSAVIWQGYQHAWEYNHRLNRFGSYVAQDTPANGTPTAVVSHTAASGTGNDTAHFKEFATEIHDARGVAFQSGYADARVECQRGDLATFAMRVDALDLHPDLQNREVYTVVLNGFDIHAEEHAEKIMTLDIEVSDPALCTGGTQVRFYILGDLRFDCRSSECQLLPWRLETERVDEMTLMEEAMATSPEPTTPEPPPKRGIDRRRFDRAVSWLKRKLTRLTGVEDVKRSIVGEGGDTSRRKLFRAFRRRYFLRFLKWRFSAPYVIRVHYLIIAGDHDALKITESEDFEHRYSWDMEHEIHRETTGVVPITVEGDDPHAYAVNTLAFRRLVADVIIDEEQGSEDPIQWGKGMHMLEWDMAIRDMQPTTQGLSADLDLFYKSWSEAMNAIITLTTWGAVRAAGHARLGARLALLQFREAAGGHQQVVHGRIHWPGRGLSAVRDPRARHEYPLKLTET
ncbi:MAG: hypothetical protein ACP5JG_15440 [Anaerolineae bacterium]